jgi:hypothetical protein
VPIGIEAVRFYRPPAGSLRCHARLRPSESGPFIGDLTLVEESGAVIAEFSGLAVMHAGTLQPAQSWLQDVQWQECERSTTLKSDGPGKPEDWLLFAGADDVAV